MKELEALIFESVELVPVLLREVVLLTVNTVVVMDIVLLPVFVDFKRLEQEIRAVYISFLIFFDLLMY